MTLTINDVKLLRREQNKSIQLSYRKEKICNSALKRYLPKCQEDLITRETAQDLKLYIRNSKTGKKQRRSAVSISPKCELMTLQTTAFQEAIRFKKYFTYFNREKGFKTPIQRESLPNLTSDPQLDFSCIPTNKQPILVPKVTFGQKDVSGLLSAWSWNELLRPATRDEHIVTTTTRKRCQENKKHMDDEFKERRWDGTIYDPVHSSRFWLDKVKPQSSLRVINAVPCRTTFCVKSNSEKEDFQSHHGKDMLKLSFHFQSEKRSYLAKSIVHSSTPRYTPSIQQTMMHDIQKEFTQNVV